MHYKTGDLLFIFRITVLYKDRPVNKNEFPKWWFCVATKKELLKYKREKNARIGYLPDTDVLLYFKRLEKRCRSPPFVLRFQANRK